MTNLQSTQHHEMIDKTVLITGATNGIGRVAALDLAQKGANVVIIGRNPERTAATVTQIKQASGNPLVEGMVGDLSMLAEVRRLADEFRQRHDRLNVLINNAGAVFFRPLISADGYEMTLALNHLSPFLLTHLLLDLLEGSVPARIINTSSNAHRMALGIPRDLRKNGRSQGWRAYSESKLMNILFTYEMARRLDAGVTVNVLHPGFVASNFGRSNGGVYKPLWSLFDLAAISSKRGARTTIHLASSPDVAGVSGKYFVRCKPQMSSPVSYDEELARRLWDASSQITGVG